MAAGDLRSASDVCGKVAGCCDAPLAYQRSGRGSLIFDFSLDSADEKEAQDTAKAK